MPSSGLIILTKTPVGVGVSGACWASVGGVNKSAIWKQADAVRNPHLLDNELVSYHLATELDLPVPDSFPHVVPKGPPVFMQLNFNGNAPLPPPLTPPMCAAAVKEHPTLTALVVAFDIFIMNTDRHGGNLAYRPAATGNPLFVLYDHGHAVFGAPGHDPAPKRFARTEWLACDGKPGNRHCLLDHLENANALEAAVSKIQGIGDARLKQIVQIPRGFGMAADDANRLLTALQKRRDRLGTIIHKNRAEFTKITQWPLGSTP